MGFINQIKNFVSRDLIVELAQLKEENASLKESLSKKQEQINAVNKYWKGVLYNQSRKAQSSKR